MADYDRRLTELLEQSWERRQAQPWPLPCLTFSDTAAREWRHFADWVEDGLRPNAWLSAHKDYGSKVAENVARLAAILELMDSAQLTISETNLWRAISLSEFYGEEFMRFSQEFSTTLESAPQRTRAVPRGSVVNDQDQVNADRLLTWLRDEYKETRQTVFSRREVQNGGPGVFRKARVTKVISALKILAARGQVDLNGGLRETQFELIITGHQF
ncbi:hypothetical protein GCM10027296_05700 [Chitinimonas naiadis]